jgi:hypothetical protein
MHQNGDKSSGGVRDNEKKTQDESDKPRGKFSNLSHDETTVLALTSPRG